MTLCTQTSGQILKGIASLKFESSTGNFKCDFSEMRLKSIGRSKKKGSESVTDEKFTLFFQTEFQIDDIQTKVNILISSMKQT